MLLVALELCSLTFQRGDVSKRNLVATSLFADGAAAVLVLGAEVEPPPRNGTRPLELLATPQHAVARHARRHGLGRRRRRPPRHLLPRHPDASCATVRPSLEAFLAAQGLALERLDHVVAHPGGLKVLEAYAETLGRPAEAFRHARDVLAEYGNMSSPTCLFVLERFLRDGDIRAGETAVVAALGPGVLLRVRARTRPRRVTDREAILGARGLRRGDGGRSAWPSCGSPPAPRAGSRPAAAGRSRPRHFPLLVALHTLYPLALIAEVVVLGARPGPAWPLWLGLWVAAQVLRVVAIRTLGDRWNVRIWVVPGEPRVRRGLYRWLPHPNYLAVVVELLSGPLLFGAWRTALLISALNALALRVRIRAEEAALAEAEGLAAGTGIAAAPAARTS